MTTSDAPFGNVPEALPRRDFVAALRSTDAPADWNAAIEAALRVLDGEAALANTYVTTLRDHEPGEPHVYSGLRCSCGEHGQIRVSVVPEVAP